MKSANDLFLLMFNLSRLHDTQKILEVFTEGMSAVFRPAVFSFSAEERGDSADLEIRTAKSRFGFIRVRRTASLPKDHFQLVQNAVQMLAVVLERIDFDHKLQQKMVSAEQAAGERLHELHQIEWMLSGKESEAADRLPSYGDLTQLNEQGLILRLVGRERLRDIVSEYLDLLETSAAVYERSGDYALGIFSSGWCRQMDEASRSLCGTADNREALAGGKWLCHESCFNDASLRAMQTGKPVETACRGGVYLYAVPVTAGGETVGAVNFGFGSPPSDDAALRELSKRYKLPVKDLRVQAEAYHTRPQFIIDYAKTRIRKSAVYLGHIIEHQLAEEQLRISEERFNLAMAVKNEGVWDWNLVTGDAYFDDRYYTMAGYEPGDFPHTFDAWADHVHPDDLAAARSSIDAYLQGRAAAFDIEFRFKHKNGSWLWIQGRGRIVSRNEDGGPLRIIGTHTDITQRKLAEMELQSNYALLQIAGKTARFGGWSVDLRENVCTWSDAVADIHEMPHGYAPKVSEGIRFYAPEWRDRITRIVAGCVEKGAAYDEEMEIITKNGKRVWVRTIGQAVQDEKGNVIRIQGSFQDVTERRQAEEMLRESERKLITLMDNLQGMVYSCVNDQHWTMKFVSEGALALTGYAPADLIDNRVLPYSDLVHPEDRAMVWNHVQEKIKSQAVFTIEYRIITRNASVKWVWERGQGVYSPKGALQSLEGFISDITERRQAEEMLRDLKDNLEIQVAQKTEELQERVAELERFYEATIGREFRIKQLNDEIERLKREKDAEQ